MDTTVVKSKVYRHFSKVDTNRGCYPGKIGTASFALTLIKKLRDCGLAIKNLDSNRTITPIDSGSQDLLYSVMVDSPSGEKKFDVTLMWSGTDVTYEILFRNANSGKWEFVASEKFIPISQFENDFSVIVRNLF
jgi:hypothetical protein